MWSAARSAKISMILCMPERVSGGDAKFQGFCDGWNKWEGQHPISAQPEAGSCLACLAIPKTDLEIEA